jgi:hypothetical protein
MYVLQPQIVILTDKAASVRIPIVAGVFFRMDKPGAENVQLAIDKNNYVNLKPVQLKMPV